MKTKLLRRLGRGALAALAGGMALVLASVRGGTYSPPDALVADAPLDWMPSIGLGQVVYLEKFNPLLGNLQAVTLSIEQFYGSGPFCFENLTVGACAVQVRETVGMTLSWSGGGLPLGEPLLEVNADTGPIEFAVGGCDENPHDFLPPGGATVELSFAGAGLPASVAYSLGAGDDLSGFIGPGQLEFVAGTQSHWEVFTPDTCNMLVTTDGSLRVRVTYEYLPPPPDPRDPLGTGTIGYWKNHPEAWPVAMLEVGCSTYSREQALASILWSSGSNPPLLLAKQLVAAKLNTHPDLYNETDCIEAAIERADALLCQYPPGAAVPKAVRTEMLSISEWLTAYNEGCLCAPSRDALPPPGGGS